MTPASRLSVPAVRRASMRGRGGYLMTNAGEPLTSFHRRVLMPSQDESRGPQAARPLDRLLVATFHG